MTNYASVMEKGGQLDFTESKVCQQPWSRPYIKVFKMKYVVICQVCVK